MRMGVINAKKFKPPLAQLLHQTRDFPGSNLVISDWISRDVLCRKRLRDDPVLQEFRSIPDAVGVERASGVARIFCGDF